MPFTITTESMRKNIASYIDDNTKRIQHNEKIFRILEGEIKSLVVEKLYDDLGTRSASAAIERTAPINYYRKVIDKLTNIYNQGVVRKVVDGTDSDQELLSWYEKELDFNQKMNANNEFYNAFRYSLLHITLDDPKFEGDNTRMPFIRSIPNHEFLVMNLSHVDPTAPDAIIVFMGKKTDPNTLREYSIYFVYTDYEFIIIDQDGNLLTQMMDELGQEYINQFMTTPFVYTNGSDSLVMPLIQSDDLDMALLVPLLLTDLNYAVKFQAFSVFVAIDVDDKKIEISPNSILSLKSDPGGGEKPSFDTIKPTIDISETLDLASSQISLWLTSKGIRPGVIGTANDKFSSGISKMIDEGDTYESREKQIVEYKKTESIFWYKLLHKFHPVWVANGYIENRTIFSPDAWVDTIFPKPKPMQTMLEQLQELQAAMDAGLESRRGALKALHPDWDDTEIDDKLAEIDGESMFNAMFEQPIEEEEEVLEDAANQ